MITCPAHGEAASFLVSFLDQQCEGARSDDEEEGNGGKRSPLTVDRALDIIRRCYAELEQRFLVNAGGEFQVKVVDRHGCRSMMLGSAGRGRIPPPPPPPPPSSPSSSSSSSSSSSLLTSTGQHKRPSMTGGEKGLGAGGRIGIGKKG